MRLEIRLRNAKKARVTVVGLPNLTVPKMVSYMLPLTIFIVAFSDSLLRFAEGLGAT